MSINLSPPPRFLGQAGPQTQQDQIVLQKWYNQVYQAINSLQTQTMSYNNAFSFNGAWTSAGTHDIRPGTWGNAGSVVVPFQFKNVPADNNIRLLRLYGTYQGQITTGTGTPSAIPAGSGAGIGFALLAYGAGQSPFVGAGLGTSGVPIYLQAQIGADGDVTVEFDFNNIGAAGLLTPAPTDPPGQITMSLQYTLYLNDTGQQIHQEITFVAEFIYEPQ